MSRRKTNEEFDLELQQHFAGDVKRLSPYVNKTTKIRFWHKCGTTYENTPKSVLRSKNGTCPNCRNQNLGRNTKKTNEEFLYEVKNLVGNEYTPLDKYVTAQTKIRMRHNKCGNIWEIKPYSFLSGKRCPSSTCIRKNECISQQDFDEEIKKLVGDEYIFVGEYKGAHTPILCRHNYCQYEWKIRPANFIHRDVRCPKCQHNIQNKDTDYFRKEVKNLVGDEYVVMTAYTRSQNKIMMRHNVCGYQWGIKPYSFLRGARCPKCSGVLKKNTEIFRREVYELEEESYTVLGEYVTAQTKIRMRHNKCGNIWEIKPYSFLSGKRCPRCRSSHGELSIENWLKRNGYFYIPQKKFPGCKDKHSLPFDFYIPSVNLIIEYDGMQHYQPVEFFGGIESFRRNSRHDAIKNKYCEDHNINLLRIPYTVTGDDIGRLIQNKIDLLIGDIVV
ncbi:hypothetical protein DKZ22_11745 [Limosilactobacillus reuteri]|uniref:CapR homology domain-containing protein n=3 Tax=Limosilactobacillus reuteri TaxID=1598 RepID=A0A855X8Y9_LIMRT|nr:hypothetical protein [Limosilactobacillus reuteri]PWT39112.1 hypothetical protein DKZ22_11745 [Limosilactobacillus reuteri]